MRSKPLRRLLRTAGAALFALPFVLPLYWAWVVSMRPLGQAPPTTIEWLPQSFSLANYRAVFAWLPVRRYLINSLMIISTGVPLALIISTMAGFALTRMRTKIRRRLVDISIALLIVPSSALWLYRFQIFRWFHLDNTLWSLILPTLAGTSPLFVLLYYWSFKRIPNEIFDSARLQGASIYQMLWVVGLPLVKPTTMAVSLFVTVLYWSDFVSPVLYIYDPNRYPLAVGLQILNQMDPTNTPVVMAGAVMMTLPILILLFALQRLLLGKDSIADLWRKNI